MAASTETTANTAAPGNPLERLREAFNRLESQQKIAFMVAIAAVIAVLVGALLWSQQPDWKVLFSNLGEKDGGAIVTTLEQQNIPHRMSDNGSIMVPGNRVHEVRLKLASQGLPRGGMVGFELMENQKFGISQFAEQVNYQRGLEGELARTIMSISAVQSARVHLAIPKPSVFVREEQKTDRLGAVESLWRPNTGCRTGCRHHPSRIVQRAATAFGQCHDTRPGRQPAFAA